jgi:hypothetical protein
MIWADFYDQIRSEVPAVESNVVDATLRRVTIEFCEETLVHVVDAAAVDIVAGTAAYSLVSPVSETDVVDVRYAWANGWPLGYLSAEQLSERNAYWPDDEADQPQWFTQQDPTQIILYRKPTVSYVGGLKMKVALRPTPTSTGVEDWIASRWFYTLASGCKAALMEMPAKPWTAPDYARQFRAQFEADKTAATIEAKRSFTRAQTRVRMSRTW